MKLLPKIILAALMLFASAGLLYDAFSGSSAIAADSIPSNAPRDCDASTIITCGSVTQRELLADYDANREGDLPQIYNHYGISRADLASSKLKAGKIWRDGRITVDGKLVATDARGLGRTDSPGSQKVSIKGKTYFLRPDTSRFIPQYIWSFVYMNSEGKYEFAIMSSCGNPVVAKPVEPPKPEPKPQSISCDALKVTITNKKNRTVEAKVMGSAQNTSISGYKINFGDGTVVNKQTAEHTYADYGKYTVIAHVSGTVNGSNKTVTSESCKQVVEFKEPPKPLVQSLECDALNLNLINVDKKYVKVSVDGTAQNTTIDEYKIDFGDGTVANEQTAEHTYADYGEYTIKAYVSGKIKEEVVVRGGEGSCLRTVEFKEDIKPCPTDPSLPIDDPKCKPCPTNPDLNYDDPNCKEPEVPELPNTGAGALVGLFSGASILGAIGHRVWLGRRLS